MITTETERPEIATGIRVAGTFRNREVGTVAIAGTVTDRYSTGGNQIVEITCDDGVTRYLRLANVSVEAPAKPKRVRAARIRPGMTIRRPAPYRGYAICEWQTIAHIERSSRYYQGGRIFTGHDGTVFGNFSPSASFEVHPAEVQA